MSKELNAIEKLTCGLVMPISGIDGCTPEHWTEVKSIITEAVSSIEEYTFSVTLVSDSDESGIIQKRIVQNLYSSDIVICDVSGRNPNVMFELGMRLAFDKPTLIIKDTMTNYSFDTGIIEHLEYPRDLRFTQIVTFKERLAKKIVATYKKSIDDPKNSVFLGSFGEFKVAKLNEKTLSSGDMTYLLVQDLQNQMTNITNEIRNFPRYNIHQDNVKRGSASIRPSTLNMFTDDMVEYINKFIKENNITETSQLINNDIFFNDAKQWFSKKFGKEFNYGFFFKDDAAFNNHLASILQRNFFWL